MTGETIVKEYRLGDATVFLISMHGLPEAAVGEMYALCSVERREKVDKITYAMKKRQSIGAGYLLYLLQKRFQIKETPVILSGGKPVFVERGDVHFNISHSGECVALAFGDAPLGVDIERVKRADLRVAKRFFAEEERACLAGSAEAERADLFCRMWTGKEAVLKASGQGLLASLESFCVLGETAEFQGSRYGLHWKKMGEDGEKFWICVAQAVEEGERCGSISRDMDCCTGCYCCFR